MSNLPTKTSDPLIQAGRVLEGFNQAFYDPSKLVKVLLIVWIIVFSITLFMVLVRDLEPGQKTSFWARLGKSSAAAGIIATVTALFMYIISKLKMGAIIQKCFMFEPGTPARANCEIKYQ